MADSAEWQGSEAGGVVEACATVGLVPGSSRAVVRTRHDLYRPLPKPRRRGARP
jgi:hypothetical protein